MDGDTLQEDVLAGPPGTQSGNGADGGPGHMGVTLSDIAACDTKLDRSLLRGVMAGAIWTADRAHGRGLRPDGDFPYCPREVREDEDHLLWRCVAWKTVQDPLVPDIMLLARALKLGPLSEWPPCLRLCGGALSAVRALQLFGRPAVVETHTLWYFGHHCCLVAGFDALGIWHFWMFTLFHPFLLFSTHYLPISTTSTLFLG